MSGVGGDSAVAVTADLSAAGWPCFQPTAAAQPNITMAAAPSASQKPGRLALLAVPALEPDVPSLRRRRLRRRRRGCVSWKAVPSVACWTSTSARAQPMQNLAVSRFSVPQYGQTLAMNQRDGREWSDRPRGVPDQSLSASLWGGQAIRRRQRPLCDAFHPAP